MPKQLYAIEQLPTTSQAAIREFAAFVSAIRKTCREQ